VLQTDGPDSGAGWKCRADETGNLVCHRKTAPTAALDGRAEQTSRTNGQCGVSQTDGPNSAAGWKSRADEPNKRAMCLGGVSQIDARMGARR
jgi:hypothetical protein